MKAISCARLLTPEVAQLLLVADPMVDVVQCHNRRGDLPLI